MLPQITKDTTLVEFYRQLMSGCPLVDGQLLDFAATATTALQSTPHGLNRPYKGAVAVLADQAVTLRGIDPSTVDEPTKRFYFQLSAATATSFRVWIF